MRKSTRPICNNLTLVCKCGKEYKGRNARLVHKLLALHASKVHNDAITTSDIDIYNIGNYNIHTNADNPSSFIQPSKTASMIHDDIKTAINWVACR